MRRNWTQPLSLYTPRGERKYLNDAERSRALAAMTALPAERALFALTLAWTGARVSEVLALTAGSFQITLPRLHLHVEAQEPLRARGAHSSAAHGGTGPALPA
jgi:integrase